MKSCPVTLDTECQNQFFRFSDTFPVCNHYQKPKKNPNFVTIFDVLLLCKKCSTGLPGASKQIEEQCFLWTWAPGTLGIFLGCAALGLPGAAPGLLLALLCTGIPELGFCGPWTQHSMSWQLSALANLWRDAVLKG